MIGVNVQGGTGAGRKRPMRQPKPWTCDCTATLSEPYHGHFGNDRMLAEIPPGPEMWELTPGSATARRIHPGRRYSCPDCGARRPS